MSTIQQIKVLQAQGYSVSAIAQRLEIDRKTVRKYLRQHDFSPTPPIPRDRSSKVEPYRATIDAWLADDIHQWYKQRHTAQRVFDRLGEAFPDRDVSYRTIRRYVKSRRQTVPTTGTLDLVWGPAEGQVDFGQTDVIQQGTRTRMRFLCLTLPYSNAGYLQLFPGEDGGGQILIIRRLRCDDCQRIHHELPDCPMPFRSYDSGSLEPSVPSGLGSTTTDRRSG